MAINSYVEMLPQLQKEANENTSITEKGQAHTDNKFEATQTSQKKNDVSETLAMEMRRQDYAQRH